MKVTLLQTDIVWGDVAENLRRAACAISEAEPSDVYVLPEMFTTGFMMKAADAAEKSSEALTWMQEQARRHDAAIVGSLAVACDGCHFNRLYFVKPDGTAMHYDKRHLFTYSGENRSYSAGGERVIVEWRGMRFMLQVCYDLRFPVWVRSRADYDAIIYVASWPTSRIRVWDTLLQARAIENQCYVLGVNRCGTDPVCSYNGSTQVVDPYGRVAARCIDNEPGAISAELDLEALQAFRKKFPVLADADGFTL